MLYVADINKIQKQIPDICQAIGFPFWPDAGIVSVWEDSSRDLLDGILYRQMCPLISVEPGQPEIQAMEYRMFFDSGCKLQKIEKWGPEKDNRGYLLEDKTFKYEGI